MYDRIRAAGISIADIRRMAGGDYPVIRIMPNIPVKAGSGVILYDYTDGTTAFDEIEDPLPFDINAPIITIGDRDYAWFYRDLVEEQEKYEGKKITFKGVVVKDDQIPRGCFIGGRHVMTCCADDIAFSGLVCNFKRDVPYKTGEWLIVTAEMRVERHKMYGGEGPVLYATDAALTREPRDPLAVFY